MDRRTIDQLIGVNIRRLREAKGWSQEVLAQNICADVGLDWTRETALRAESARRKLSAAELLAVCFVLEAPLRELLAGKGAAWIAELSLPVDMLVDMLDSGFQPASASTPRSRSTDALLGRSPPVAEWTPDLATQRAAKTLGIEPLFVDMLAHRLWGRSLSAVRDQRAGEGANRMKKAHVTRELYTELSASLALTRKW